MCLAHGTQTTALERKEQQERLGSATGLRRRDVAAGPGTPEEEAELGPDGQVTSQLLRKETRLSKLLGTQGGVQMPVLWILEASLSELLNTFLSPFYLPS